MGKSGQIQLFRSRLSILGQPPRGQSEQLQISLNRYYTCVKTESITKKRIQMKIQQNIIYEYALF
jgi:hypothetical protein